MNVNSRSLNACAGKPELLRKIKAVAMDVDGVLTDGGFWWSASGDELKRFSFADATGIARARAAGLIIALISGESSAAGMALVQRYAEKLGIGDVYKGCHDKAAALKDFAARHQLRLDQVCFMGDDLIDLPAMRAAGLSAAPADAQAAVLTEARFVSRLGGGHGAVRDVLDAILARQTTKT